MIDLRLGDAMGGGGMRTLADRSVDLVLTDPPFDARTHRASIEGPRRGADGHRSMAGSRRVALPFAALSDADVARVARELARVARRWIVVFVAERQIETWATAFEAGGARFVRLGIALRTSPRPQLSGDRPAPHGDHLVIAHAGDAGRMRWNGGGKASVWRSPPARFDFKGGRAFHSTPKALELTRSLVSDFSDAGDLVADPFAGGGSTGVAALALGRRFLGWEVSPVYHARALRRLESTHEQLTLDVGPALEAVKRGNINRHSPVVLNSAPLAGGATAGRGRPKRDDRVVPNSAQGYQGDKVPPNSAEPITPTPSVTAPEKTRDALAKVAGMGDLDDGPLLTERFAGGTSAGGTSAGGTSAGGTSMLETSALEVSTKASTARPCRRCGRSLPPGIRSHAVYHRSCRELAYRERINARARRAVAGGG